MAGGISVAYVFLHIFPELEKSHEGIAAQWLSLPILEHHAYLVALIGLVVFYGLERVVKLSHRRQLHDTAAGGATGSANGGVFWLHVSSFAVYNALIGYLLWHREEQDTRGLLFFAVAMTLHFLVNDYGLRQDHKQAYRRIGRWILAGAILVGWATGLLISIGDAATDVLFAFLAGGVVLNVLKEELPEERQSRFAPFALGTAAYGALLLLL